MSELLNLVGLSTGVALYAMLLTMVVRAARAPSAREAFDPVLLATALLGLLWNLCALPAYELPKVGIIGPFPWLVAIGFGALGFLPAVVVHSILRGRPGGIQGVLNRSLVSAAYAVSTIALVLQFRAAADGRTVPSALAMQLLTYTFIALVLPLATVTRGQPGARRALWIAALAIFAVSALHLSEFHQGDASWPIELLGHHASVPLAFAMLYQDYPFALADLFLKRALALLLLVATSFVAIALFGASSAAFARLVQMDPRQIGALVTVWVATALVYPTLRRGASWFVDVVVLHRPDYRSLRATITRRLQGSEDPPAGRVPRPRAGRPESGMSARLRVVIADDERPARSFLRSLLRSFEDVLVVGEAESGQEAVTVIEHERPDLALLDLDMPELDGFGVVRMLKKQIMPLIAFVTAYDEYAVRAFEVNAVDYLLKPVDKSRLRATLNRAQERIEHAEIVEEQTNRVGTAIAAYERAAQGPYLERIPVRRRDEIAIVPVQQIASIVAEGELLHLMTVANEKFTITYRLKDLETRLDPARFIRLGRGTLANIDLISKVSVMPGGTHVAILGNGQKLQGSRLQSRILRERFPRL